MRNSARALVGTLVRSEVWCRRCEEWTEERNGGRKGGGTVREALFGDLFRPSFFGLLFAISS